MRNAFGICCIGLGICCLMASVGFIVHNNREEEKAQIFSKNILQAVQENIQDIKHKETDTTESLPDENIPDRNSPDDEIPDRNSTEESLPEESNRDEYGEIPADIPQEMLTTQVDGYDCIGVLSIPVLELELPILTDWSYAKLKIAPCHYFGSYYETDFVIAAHNYQSHFGRLTEIQPKDLILFTDISGTVHCYEVVLS